jgi:hypothetical protein
MKKLTNSQLSMTTKKSKNHIPILHVFVLQQSLNIGLGTTHNNIYIYILIVEKTPK